ncbi:hypothetical protein BDV93DRAFT_514078 [Ceratobasidium sp. AG-I]|nr:hypothetical protein BDV93DRAFT_514078 [Ceratobasidium sp. AG-I]
MARKLQPPALAGRSSTLAAATTQNQPNYPLAMAIVPALWNARVEGNPQQYHSHWLSCVYLTWSGAKVKSGDGFSGAGSGVKTLVGKDKARTARQRGGIDACAAARLQYGRPRVAKIANVEPLTGPTVQHNHIIRETVRDQWQVRWEPQSTPIGKCYGHTGANNHTGDYPPRTVLSRLGTTLGEDPPGDHHLNGVIDSHVFSPRQAAVLVANLEACFKPHSPQPNRRSQQPSGLRLGWLCQQRPALVLEVMKAVYDVLRGREWYARALRYWQMRDAAFVVVTQIEHWRYGFQLKTIAQLIPPPVTVGAMRTCCPCTRDKLHGIQDDWPTTDESTLHAERGYTLWKRLFRVWDSHGVRRGRVYRNSHITTGCSHVPGDHICPPAALSFQDPLEPTFSY